MQDQGNSCDKYNHLSEKSEAELARYTDTEVLYSVKAVLQGEDRGNVTLPEGMGPGDIANIILTPAANVDVERSFSVYKNVLTERRQCLTEENLKRSW